MQGVSAVGVMLLAFALHEMCGQSSASVISIDFGSEWIKVALVKPGVPMEIVLNKESQRKTPAVVTLRNDERLFAGGALANGIKYPKEMYWYLQSLLGQKYDSPMVQQYRRWFPYYDIRQDAERGTIQFQHGSETTYTPEELVAMILNNSRSYSEDYAGQSIRDVVITVPSFFTQAQRRAMLHAASLAGLNVVQLMSTSAAAALNYGLFRQSNFNSSTHTVMFYDMGAGGTVATIVEYKMVQDQGSVLPVPQLIVKGTGYDRTLGGFEMDVRLRDHLAAVFTNQHKSASSVYKSPRAMTKLLQEAKRLKQIFSVNTDFVSQVESVVEEVDFKATITRATFEELCTDLFDRVAYPVEQALKSADMTIGEIDAVILVGGATRVPKVQQKLLEATKRDELWKNLNADEAPALGAVYQGATRSKLFKVKKFIVKEGVVFPIEVSFVKEDVSEEGKETEKVEKVMRRTLFQRSNPYPSKKVLTFSRNNDDFSFDVFYGSLDFLSPEERSSVGVTNISQVFLTGVKEAHVEHAAAESKGIKVHFRMDENGLLNLDSVESRFEYPEGQEEESTLSKIGSKISSFFGGSTTGDEVKDADEEGDGSQPPEQQATPSEQQTTPPEERETPQDTPPSSSDEQPEGKDTGTKEEEEGSSTPAGEKEGERTGADESSSHDGTESPDSADGAGKQADEKKQDEGTTSTKQSNAVNKTATAGSKEKAGKVAKVILNVQVKVLDLEPPSDALSQASIAKLKALQARDDEKNANAQAKNGLEAFILNTQALLKTEPFMAVSNKEQRNAITEALAQDSMWLEEDGYVAETEAYTDKLRELRRTCKSLFKRVDEAEKRPKLVTAIKDGLKLAKDFAVKAKNLTADMNIFTDVELSTLATLVEETEQWLEKKLAQQKVLPPHEDPVLHSSDLEDYRKRVEREMMYLINKLRTHPPPKPKNGTNATNSSKPSPKAEKGPEPQEPESPEPAASPEPEPPTEENKPKQRRRPTPEPPKEEEEQETLALPDGTEKTVQDEL